MGYPMFDCAVRTSNVTSGASLVTLVPQAAAIGTGRVIRMRQVAISNTTATGFGIGLGIGGSAGTTPATPGTILRRGTTVGATDPATTSQGVFTSYTTQPTTPTAYSVRLWVPGSSMVVWVWNDGEELIVPPAATALPFGVWNTGVGQISDITLTWEE